MSLGYFVKSCPDGWVRYKHEKCFKAFLTVRMKWVNAVLECQKDNESSLASVHSKDELQFLSSYLLREFRDNNTTHVWIGGQNKGQFWVWEDLSPFDFMDWFPGYPKTNRGCIFLATSMDNYNDGQEKFGKMATSVSCDTYAIHFICQKYQVEVKRLMFIHNN